MKNFLLIGLLAIIASSSISSVSLPHAKNILSGSYRFTHLKSSTLFSLELEISREGQVEITQVNGQRLVLGGLYQRKATSTFISSSSEQGPNELPVLSIRFTTGSDEETETYHFILSVQQWSMGRPSQPILLSSFYTLNDGPNSYAYSEVQKKLKGYKKNSDGKFIQFN